MTLDGRNKPRTDNIQPVRSLNIETPGVVVVFQQTAGNAGRVEVTLRTRPSQPVTVFLNGNHAHVNLNPARIEIDPSRATSQYFVEASLRFDEQYPPPPDNRYTISVATGCNDLQYNSKNAQFAGFFINSGGRSNSCVLPFLTLKQFNEQ